MLKKDWTWRMEYHSLYKKEFCDYLSTYLEDEWEFRSRDKIKMSAYTYDFVYKKIWDYVDKYADMYDMQFDNPTQLYHRCFCKIIRIMQNIFDFWDDWERDEQQSKERETEKNNEMCDLIEEELYVFYNYK